MRKMILPIAAAAMLFSVGAAFANTETTSGVVQSYDKAAMTITLNDGKTFHLPYGFDEADLKAGSTVVLIWDHIPDAKIDQNTDQVTHILVKN